MIALRTLSLALFAAGLTAAAPLNIADPTQALVTRQSTTWNDPYIKAPYGETAQQIGACSYQITQRRDDVDNRYDIKFEAIYPGSSERIWVYQGRQPQTEPYGGLPDSYSLRVSQLLDICQNGQAPTTLFIRSTLLPGFSYSNDHISAPITPTTQGLPIAPTDVRVARTSDSDYTATWAASGSATGGYIAVVGIDVYASETGGFIGLTQTIFTGPGVTSATFRVTGRDRFRDIAVTSQAATDVVSDITTVRRFT